MHVTAVLMGAATALYLANSCFDATVKCEQKYRFEENGQIANSTEIYNAANATLILASSDAESARREANETIAYAEREDATRRARNYATSESMRSRVINATAHADSMTARALNLTNTMPTIQVMKEDSIVMNDCIRSLQGYQGGLKTLQEVSAIADDVLVRYAWPREQIPRRTQEHALTGVAVVIGMTAICIATNLTYRLVRLCRNTRPGREVKLAADAVVHSSVDNPAEGEQPNTVGPLLDGEVPDDKDIIELEASLDAMIYELSVLRSKFK